MDLYIKYSCELGCVSRKTSANVEGLGAQRWVPGWPGNHKLDKKNLRTIKDLKARFLEAKDTKYGSPWKRWAGWVLDPVPAKYSARTI